MKSNSQNKKDFYSDKRTVENYENLRFSNAGGKFVHQEECRVMAKFLGKCNLDGPILDIPTGTGRMLSLIESSGFNIIYAADYSEEMLLQCKKSNNIECINITKQDIYNTSYEDGSFETIVSSRFLFHSDDQQQLFNEFSRIISSNGYLIFDSLGWSPRAWSNLFSNKLGGDIYTNSNKSVAKLASDNDFDIIRCESILMLPSFIYNFFPKWILCMIQNIEPYWPSILKTKTVWLLRRNER
ncbi:class I SAM-dependent methyltransferase [Vibrio breoganii]|uniref:class I SAM-dependent methyltransferase n=1 Tax=Vibrio breoganii TaxID=553239 RepID=UPI0021C443D7|nr:class I SAM-dependent methyltransferase [Vibrio breoganii]MDN3717483.1 class I SAM-dependent methyltransferase [Vibrio breoganii]